MKNLSLLLIVCFLHLGLNAQNDVTIGKSRKFESKILGGEKLSLPEIKAHFKALSEEYGFTVNPKQGVLLDMAFDLNDENKTDQAIGIMKYLVALYPDSEVNYYRLGRLLQKTGDVESAKANYQMALQINAGYEPAKAALVKLTKEQDQL